MIILSSVSKELGQGRFKTVVLEDINWTIQPRSQIVILGQHNSGTSVLLDIMAGLSLPTRGWVERRASLSPPGGYLRYARFGTLRHLVQRLSQFYRADPRDIIEFTISAMRRHDILDIPVNQLPHSIRHQLNMALIYAIPCDFHLFNGSIDGGRAGEFRAFCRQAFALRSKQAGTIVTASSSKLAAELGEGATVGVLFRSKLTLYEHWEDAIAVFDSLPPEPAVGGEELVRPEPAQEEDEIF